MRETKVRSESNGCGSEAGAGWGADGYYVRDARRHDQARPFRYGSSMILLVVLSKLLFDLIIVLCFCLA